MKRFWPLAAILLVFVIVVSLEIGWGLPGPRRTELLFPGGLTDQTVADLVERSQGQLAAAGDTPIPLLGRGAEPPPYDRDQALDACRRFLLYTENPDEMLTIMALARIKPGEIQFDPGMGQYGGAFLYPLGAWLKAATMTGLARQGNLEHYLRHSEDMGRIYLVGRAFVALCVALALVVIYRIGERLGGPVVAATAAGLAALSPAVLTWSVVLKPHAAALLPGMLAVYWALAYYESPRWRTLVAAGVAAGVAVGMTLVAAPLGLSVLAAVWLEKRRQGRHLVRTAALVLTAGAAFLATNPYTIISYADRLEESAGVRSFYEGGASPWQVAEYLAGPMREAAGAVFLVLGLVAMVMLLAQQFRRAAVLVLPVVAAMLAIPLTLGDWAGEPQMARFALPVLPLLALASAWWLDRVGLLRRPMAAAMLIGALTVALPTVLTQAMNAAGHSPRHDAAAVLNRQPNVPLLVEYPAAPFRAPPVSFLDHRLIYAAPAGKASYVRASTSWRPLGEDGPDRVTFSLVPGRPDWLRAPLTFADRDVVLTFHAPAPNPEPSVSMPDDSPGYAPRRESAPPA